MGKKIQSDTCAFIAENGTPCREARYWNNSWRSSLCKEHYTAHQQANAEKRTTPPVSRARPIRIADVALAWQNNQELGTVRTQDGRRVYGLKRSGTGFSAVLGGKGVTTAFLPAETVLTAAYERGVNTMQGFD